MVVGLMRRLVAGAFWGVAIWFVARLVLGLYVAHTTGQDLPLGPHRVMVKEQAVLRFFAQYDLWFKFGAATVAVWGTWTRRLPGTDPDRSRRGSVPVGGTAWEPWETPVIWGDNASQAPTSFVPPPQSPIAMGTFGPMGMDGIATQSPLPMAPAHRPCFCGGVKKICPQCQKKRGTWLYPEGEQGSGVWVPCPACHGSGEARCTDCDE